MSGAAGDRVQARGQSVNYRKVSTMTDTMDTPNEGDPLDVREMPTPNRELAGDHADDDGQAIDQFFEAMNAGPQEYGIPVPTPTELPVTTRLLSRTLNVTTDPVMFYPADPRRQRLYVQVDATGNPTLDTLATIQIASSRTECYGAAKFWPYGSNSNAHIAMAVVFDLDGHTGPVWVRVGDTGGFVGNTVNVSVWCVTV